MRIIAGTAGRIPLNVPKMVTRPTTDRVREALFSILGSRVAEARVLDLFAGSGALGIEALSRGAKSALFVEQHRGACQVIKKNLTKTKLGGDVRNQEVFALLKHLSQPPFDLIFADPPYHKRTTDQNFTAQLLENESLPNLTSPDAWLIIEREATPLTIESPHWFEHDIRKYGSSQIHFFQRKPSTSA